MKEKRTNHYMLNGGLVQSRSKQFVKDGIRFVYSNKNGAEFLSTRGPLADDFEIMLYQMDQGVKNEISYSYIAPHDILSSLANRVDAMPTQFYWTRRGWSECSTSCGQGIEQENMDCVDVETKQASSGYLCGIEVRPKPAKRVCNLGPCRGPAYRWRTGKWSGCSRSCGGRGLRYRYIQCVEHRHGRDHVVSRRYCTASTKPAAREQCNTAPCPARWKLGTWSKCSASCGQGTQYRSVLCNKPQDGKLYQCINPQPASTQPCHQQACPNHYSWKTEDWGQCSHSCGRYGRKQRRVYCVQGYGSRQSEVKPRYCVAKSRPDTTTSCNVHVCPLNWNVGQWSKCSVSCGSGVQVRRVSCEKPDHHNVYTCSEGSKPSSRQTCTLPSCPVLYTWSSDQWSACTATCGSRGIRQRHVKCIRTYNEVKDTIDYRYCDQSQRPEHTEHCNTEPCPLEWTVGHWSKCSVTCGKGKQTRKVVCDKPQDGSTYICPSPKPVISQTCITSPCREDFSWRTGAWSQCTRSCGNYGIQQRHLQCIGRVSGQERSVDHGYCRHEDQPEYSRSCNQQPCPALWKTGSWTKCSASCGVGLQRRIVTCQKPNDGNIYQCLSEKPSTYQKCKIMECTAKKLMYRWQSDEWSPCSRTCGSFSVKRRQVHCMKTENGVQSTASARHCGYRHRPVRTKMCKKTACPAHWRVGQWSSCSTSCGPGVRRRSVKCDKHQSNQQCNAPQPADTQLCELKPCPVTRGRLSKPAIPACHDRSVFCRLAQSSPSLCRNDTYRNRCCETCHRLMPS